MQFYCIILRSYLFTWFNPTCVSLHIVREKKKIIQLIVIKQVWGIAKATQPSLLIDSVYPPELLNILSREMRTLVSLWLIKEDQLTLRLPYDSSKQHYIDFFTRSLFFYRNNKKKNFFYWLKKHLNEILNCNCMKTKQKKTTLIII